MKQNQKRRTKQTLRNGGREKNKFMNEYMREREGIKKNI